MKGIVLAGGSGTRLFPTTSVTSKQLLPVFDKPTIYYPLSVLMLAGIKDILFISTPRDLPRIEELLGDGSNLGINLSYKVQEKPEGIAQAFLIGEDFIGDDSVCLILGDNIFYGQHMSKELQQAANLKEGANVFAYHVNDPERYGIVTFDRDGRAVEIEEKPKDPKSHWAVTGLYFYDNSVVDIVKNQKPSARGELEITDVNKVYLQRNQLTVSTMGRGYAWLDTGTDETLLEASQFIHTLEKRQGLKVACLEEIAFNMKYITAEELAESVKDYPESGYGQYIKNFAKQAMAGNLVNL
jgi:glucose-1-phosphate thymidylyltransferase